MIPHLKPDQSAVVLLYGIKSGSVEGPVIIHFTGPLFLFYTITGYFMK
jgi:hypothetical protein